MRQLLVPFVALFAVSCGDSSATVHEPGVDQQSTRGISSGSVVIDSRYDAEGNLTQLERAGAVTTMRWDRLARPTTVTDALGGETSLRWTARDQLATVTDPRGVSSSFSRDGLEQLVHTASPDTGETISEHDEAGNVVFSRDARGVEARWTWDALNRKTGLRSSRAGSTDVSFTWSYDDADGGAGRLSATTFPGGSSALHFDLEGRLVVHQQTVGQLETEVRYAYDTADRPTSITYPSGRVLELEVDGGQPLRLSVVERGVRRSLLEQLTLDVDGTVAGWTWQLPGNPVRRDLRRDAAGRVSGYSLGSAVRTLVYDEGNRIIGYRHANTDGPLPALDESFSYDALDRLVGFTRDGRSVAVTYDPNGNRTALGSVEWAIDPLSNRLERATTDAGVRSTYAFDPAGRLISTGAQSLSYELSGRLASVTTAGGTTTYTVDAMGLRVRKANDSVDLTFVYDQRGHLLGEYLQTGTPVREYLWLDDTLVAFFAGSELLFVECDHLRAPRVAFDLAGTPRWRWRSGPFGEDAPDPAPTGLAPITLPLRFPGQYADDESGLLYNHFRDYDPATGRYIQPDPLGLAGGPHRYAYVENDPVSLVDPEGLIPSDKWFGHTDPGFQRWWHTHPDGKSSGWFSSADPGFDPRKPLDIPNKDAADRLREEYEARKKAGTLETQDDCKRQRRIDRARRGFRRGGGGRGLE